MEAGEIDNAYQGLKSAEWVVESGKLKVES